MIKFETINGTLCRMVEPTPLTPEATFPCVVRLIQDDSPMGRANKMHDFTASSLQNTYLVKRVSDYSVYTNDSKEPISCYAYYEIIGYPVVEGSVEWAAYMAQQGNFVCHPVLGAEEYFWWNAEKNCISCKRCDLLADSFFTSFMPYIIQNSGWQIHEPNTDFKVGDWV